MDGNQTLEGFEIHRVLSLDNAMLGEIPSVVVGVMWRARTFKTSDIYKNGGCDRD